MSDLDKNHMTARLDEIREGSVTMVALVQRALSDAQRDLAEGRLSHARENIGVAHNRIAGLEQAHDALGVLAGKYVIEVQDLEPGMQVASHGKVTGIEGEQHYCKICEEPHDYIRVEFDDGAAEVMRADGEVVIDRESVATD